MFSLCLLIVLGSSFLLGYVFFSYLKLGRVGSVDEKARFVSDKIAEGASAFLSCLYKYLSFFILFFALLIMFIASTKVGSLYIDNIGFLYFVFGSILSMVAGYVAMKISTKSNILVAVKAKDSLKGAFNRSFNSGNLIGITIVGSGIFGLGFLFLLNIVFNKNFNIYFCTNMVLFALGVECVALFCRVAGGIFTKAADIGADLVGKLEKNIPEDDSRNPAVIADNVGDNVGDIAGMGSDLLGSFISTVVSCVFLFIMSNGGCSCGLDISLVLFPLLFCFFGALASVFINKIITYLKSENVSLLFRVGVFSITIVNALIGSILVFNMFPSIQSECFGVLLNNVSAGVYVCVLIGLIASIFVSFITRYYTDSNYCPVKGIVQQSKAGASTNLISGLCVGMESLFFPVLIYSSCALLAYSILGFYGVSLAAVAVMSTALTHLSIDAFGPISDNAGGIVEMCKFGNNVRENTDVLDSLGNTTAATGKSFAITSAVFTFFSLFACILGVSNIKYSYLDIHLVSGLLFGAMVPYLFSSMVIKSVASAAMKIIDEVRRQFKNVDSDNGDLVDYSKCVLISTVSSVSGMIKPACVIFIFPVLVLSLFNDSISIGFLIGLFLSSVLLGIFHSNVGGAFDNVKKAIEAGVVIDGVEYSKKSLQLYKSAVVGDTVGDPLKDTSGPSMNIILKITSFIFVLLFPLLFKNVRGGSFLNSGKFSKNYNNNGSFDVSSEPVVKVDDVFSELSKDVSDGHYASSNTKKRSKNVAMGLKDEPEVYVNEDENGNFEKLTKYKNGYVYESYYSK